jgi:hypothetical protein
MRAAATSFDSGFTGLKKDVFRDLRNYILTLNVTKNKNI